MAKVPVGGVTKVHVAAHLHELPVCKDSVHDISCKGHGAELFCVSVLVPEPGGSKTGKLRRMASCTHLFR